MITIKRVYDFHSQEGCYSILVDRLWPRGFSKGDAMWDEWIKEVATSSELRKWFGHEPERWDEFRTRYLAELSERQESILRIRELEQHGNLVLLFSAKDPIHNQAVVLQEYPGTA